MSPHEAHRSFWLSNSFAHFFFGLCFQDGELCGCALQQHPLAAISRPKGPLVFAGQGER